MVFPVKSFTTLSANLILASRMDNHVSRKVFVTLKRFTAHRTLVRSVLVVTLFVSVKMLLAFQTSPAYITDVRTLSVLVKVLVQSFPIIETIRALWTVVDEHACGKIVNV